MIHVIVGSETFGYKRRGIMDLAMSEYSNHPICGANMFSNINHKETWHLCGNFHSEWSTKPPSESSTRGTYSNKTQPNESSQSFADYVSSFRGCMRTCLSDSCGKFLKITNITKKHAGDAFRSLGFSLLLSLVFLDRGIPGKWPSFGMGSCAGNGSTPISARFDCCFCSCFLSVLWTKFVDVCS